MNYIDKEKLIKADIASIENKVRHAFNQGYDLGFKDGKEKAKSQEPILDKIRERIELEKLGYPPSAGYYKAIMKVLQILDNYKEEVEPQESDHKCHTCKHYTSGDHDGSCGSYICKEYSNWESEE